MKKFSLGKRSKAPEQASADSTPSEDLQAEQPVRTEGFTGGSALVAKVIPLMVYLAIALALVMGAMAFLRPSGVVSAATDKTGPAGLTLTEQSAGGYALGYVGAWLGATRDSPDELKSYTQLGSGIDLPSKATPYKDLVVEVVDPQGKGIIRVVIAGAVQETAADGKTIQWPRRSFQVTVNSTAGLSVVGYPTPISATANGAQANLGYPVTVPASDDSAATVAAFLGAYAAGQGDLSRYITPGSPITAILPAPYLNVKLSTLLADATPAKNPSDGNSVRVLAQAQVSTANGASTATYALTLTARAGRWEISALDPNPIIASDSTRKPSTSAIPTTPKGN